jgi:hypothetical protein
MNGRLRMLPDLRSEAEAAGECGGTRTDRSSCRGGNALGVQCNDLEPSNSLAAGTVAIGDNDTGSAIFSMTGMKPGSTDTGCIQVTYTGSLASTVRLYTTTAGTGPDPYINLVVTRGDTSSGSFDSCTNFTADATDYIGSGAGVIYSGTLQGVPTTTPVA